MIGVRPNILAVRYAREENDEDEKDFLSKAISHFGTLVCIEPLRHQRCQSDDSVTNIMETTSLDSTHSLRNLYFVRTAFQVMWAAFQRTDSQHSSMMTCTCSDSVRPPRMRFRRMQQAISRIGSVVGSSEDLERW